MERRPRGEGEPIRPIPTEEGPSAVGEEAVESWNERVIREGIEAAVREGRPVDNRTARYIAGQLHGGQATALYALASSGAVQAEVFGEMDRDRAEQPAQTRVWLASLTVYCATRGESGPVARWVEEAEAQDRADLMHRISTAGVATLGQIATVHTPDEPADDQDTDVFAWIDAARWSPTEESEADSQLVEGLSEEELDAIFVGGCVDSEVGDMYELGWYGLIHWPDRPGGLIVRLDEHDIRQSWVVASDDALTTRWATITSEYAQYHEQRGAYEQAIGEPDATISGIAPRVWVGSLADYTNGQLHGAWFDATREPAELEMAAKHLLRLGHTPDAEEWAIMDYDGFAGAELGEYESFETICRIATGIADYGEAFGHWAAYVGNESTDEIERFGDHYRGEWESFEAYVRDYLEETEFYRFLEHVPEDMRGYVRVDVEQIAQDWSGDYLTVELRNGQVGVFDTPG